MILTFSISMVDDDIDGGEWNWEQKGRTLLFFAFIIIAKTLL